MPLLLPVTQEVASSSLVGPAIFYSVTSICTPIPVIFSNNILVNFTGELAGAGVPQVFDGTRIWFCNYAIAQIEGAA